MNNNNAKKIFKMAVLVYLASFFIINWNDVSWVFNYKVVSGLTSEFFNPYPSINASTLDPYFYPNHSGSTQTGQNANTPTISPNIKTTYTDKQNTLEIPKLSLSVPIIFSKSADKALITKDLDLGTVYYPGSVYPGQVGQIVILGHSAPPGWPTIKHDWVFSDINKLEAGDEVLIDLNNKQYTYIVKQKTIIKRGAEVPQDNLSADNNVLTLISCWPPGKDYQRITVSAILKTN
jgi:LPXTG-site transpeptidase (sortase) family protein